MQIFFSKSILEDRLILWHEGDKHKLFYVTCLCDSRYLENDRMNKDCVQNTTNVHTQ